MLIVGLKHISPLCLNILGIEKQIFWTYRIFLYSYHALLKNILESKDFSAHGLRYENVIF